MDSSARDENAGENKGIWLHLIALMLFWLASPLQFGHAQSAPEVELHASGGAVVHVVPLYVDEEGLFVDRFCGDWSSNSIPVLDGVLYLEWHQVDSIVLSASTTVVPFLTALVTGFLWMIPGTIVGGVTGQLFCGRGREADDCVSTAATIGGAAAFIAGTVFNWPHAEQEGDKSYHPSNHDEREMLRELCVYSDTLPEALLKKFRLEEAKSRR